MERTRTPGTSDGLWERLIAENVGWLRGWVRARVRDPEAVHDICQEAILKALRSKRALRYVGRFPSWLYRIAANTLRDHLRRAARRKKKFSLADDLDAIESSSADSERLAKMEEAERLLATIDALPPRYREPFVLRHSRDLSYKEIGELLGISENAVQVRIFRARKMLRERLGEGRSQDSAPRGGT